MARIKHRRKHICGKIREDRESQGHQLVEKVLKSAGENKLENIAADMQREQHVVTEQFFYLNTDQNLDCYSTKLHHSATFAV
jgi:hypothetical protein